MAKTADPQNQSDTGANIRNRGRFRNDPGCVTKKPVITYELKARLILKLDNKDITFFLIAKKSGDVTAAGCHKKRPNY